MIINTKMGTTKCKEMSAQLERMRPGTTDVAIVGTYFASSIAIEDATARAHGSKLQCISTCLCKARTELNITIPSVSYLTIPIYFKPLYLLITDHMCLSCKRIYKLNICLCLEISAYTHLIYMHAFIKETHLMKTLRPRSWMKEPNFAMDLPGYRVCSLVMAY